ncbi:oxaloacetate decarboxylase, mitochondrial [Halyomorpha halys]|uniref:oxaloacetate decarboxylase, mitochondrial n=1 Tax=Halyomorpha halys TaxID=286706 RepID=UPI0006D509AE|nr:acylpyruvase FAHD1, mitochondrial [Halyomorpha halys]
MRSFDVQKFYSFGKKIVGAGLNFRSVVKERRLSEPSEPVVFLKPTSSYLLDGQPIQIPVGFEVHHEIELGVIIGQKCKNIKPNEANNYIGGYCLALDLTAKNLMDISRSKGLPWTFGKGFDGACPISSAITSDCLSYPDDVRLWCSINGVIKQDCRTSDMIFPIPHLLSYISKYMTLEPYDLILTGSPAGTGPIKKGDVIQGGLEDILHIKFYVN